MRDQIASESALPARCTGCGGRISESVSFCPHCGARARFASAAGATHVSRDGGSYAAAPTRFEPPMRSFAPTDFEGDLDTPWSDPAGTSSAPPARDPDARTPSPTFLRLRQWGLKRGMGLTLAAFVVLFGGVTLLHRYDRSSISAASRDGVSQSADGSIPSNRPGDSNVTGSTNDGLGTQGASGVLGGAAPPNGNAGGAQTHPGKAESGESAQSRHAQRGRAHGHPRPHAHAKRWHARSRDTTYLHVEAQPPRDSERSGSRLARSRYQPSALRII